MKKTEYYFVYGTLKRGHGNNRILAESKTAKYIEDASTNSSYTMVSLGGFPGVTYGGNTSIKGEIWSVSDEETKTRLDRLEGYRVGDSSSLYFKRKIKIGKRLVNIYLFNDKRFGFKDNKIESGTW